MGSETLILRASMKFREAMKTFTCPQTNGYSLLRDMDKGETMDTGKKKRSRTVKATVLFIIFMLLVVLVVSMVLPAVNKEHIHSPLNVTSGDQPALSTTSENSPTGIYHNPVLHQTTIPKLWQTSTSGNLPEPSTASEISSVGRYQNQTLSMQYQTTSTDSKQSTTAIAPPHLVVDPGNGLSYSSVLEGSPLDTEVAKVDIKRADGDKVTGVQCKTASTSFSLKPSKPDGVGYSLVTTEVLDREDQALIIVELECNSSDTGKLTKLHEVRILDVNDCAPEFEKGHYLMKVTENNPRGTHLLTVKAHDRDVGQNAVISYGLSNGAEEYIDLNAKSGELRAKISFDHETHKEYTFQVVGTDHGNASKSSRADVTLTVEDINDCAPVFEKQHYHIKVKENNKRGAHLLSVKAYDSDAGQNAVISYSVSNGAKQFILLDTNSGELKAKISFDHETRKEYTFQLVATDHGTPSKSTRADVTLTVEDINDEGPRFLQGHYYFTIQEKYWRVGQVRATDADDPPFDQVKYSLHNDFGLYTHFGIDEREGTIHTTIYTFELEEGIHTYTVKATNTKPPYHSCQTDVSIEVIKEPAAGGAPSTWQAMFPWLTLTVRLLVYILIGCI